jgi:hypothetical protein
VIGLITGCLATVVAVMDDAFISVYNFRVPLALKIGCPSSGVGCDIALVFIFLCVGLMAIFCGVTFFSSFLSIGVYFVVSQSWCGVSRLLVEFLRVHVSLSGVTHSDRDRNIIVGCNEDGNWAELAQGHIQRQTVLLLKCKFNSGKTIQHYLNWRFAFKY